MLSSVGTGFDYTHPLPGGNFGPGNKVIGGYDFVGDKYDASKYPLFVKSCSSTYYSTLLLGTNTVSQITTPSINVWATGLT